MNNKSKILAIIVFLSLVNGISYAKEKITFASFPIPMMVENESSGVFIKLTKEIARRGNMDIRIVVYPTKRSINLFIKKKVDVLFPTLVGIVPANIKVINGKESIYVKRDFIFTKKGSTMLRSIQDLEGKKVGLTRGYPYFKGLIQNDRITFERVNSDEANTRKLIKNRINAFVVEERSGLKAFKKTGLFDNMQYDPTTPVSKQRVFYMFQSTKKGKRLEKIVSGVMREMKKDGSFGKIMSEAKP
jgi:polar amino acid transport system substrate-binding protein